jgi:hypothetical protein
MPRLPNFFIAGAPKAGTTSLYRYLEQHPQIYMSPVKEPHYFAAEIREELYEPALRRRLERDKPFARIVADWDDYVQLFANAAGELALGEGSVCYLWSPTAPGRIAEKIPEAKILVLLRDPAERAFSQYLHGLGNGAIRWSFREHMERNQRHRSTQLSVHYPFLEFGFYAAQLARYREHFGQNIWVGFHEDFRRRPAETIAESCRFLGVSAEFSPDMTEKHLQAQVPRVGAIGWLKHSGLWQAAARVTPKGLRPIIRRSLIRKPGETRMERADRRYLVDYYRDDIVRLAGMVGRDLGEWLRC